MMTISTCLAIFLNKSTETWPSILSSDETESFVESKVSCKNGIMLVLEDTELEVMSRVYHRRYPC
jgi:hypothetical protein